MIQSGYKSETESLGIIVVLTMERVRVLCLLLLLCSLSGAELQDNEITEQIEANPESVDVSEQPQPCPPDVHAVLRDMIAKLTALQVKVEQLQTLNQEQAAKLAKNEAGIQELHTLNHDQAAELRSLKSWANGTGNQVDTLWRDKAVGQVAFSASLLASGSGYIGPFNTDTPLVFRYVFSNIGDAYNQHTGIFTAPVRGAYHFELHVGGHGHATHPSEAGLVKNGEFIISANEHQTNGFGTGSNGATLLLELGDVVFPRMARNKRIFDSEFHHSTFSGHLLFPM